ncbi:MAG: aspartate aminotransferase family protein [Marinilabiliales bacterium]|nr:MAG: aspartate aminotransferase family protein [Marinilabiliales bacterium]
MSHRQLFFKHIAQTSDVPLQLEIERAEGIFMYTPDGKQYIDLLAGISVSNVGHRHPKVLEAVNDQLGKYMHLMVYGEYIQSPQVVFAQNICNSLPESLNSVFYVNSGSEATEGALKLAKRYTGKPKIVGHKNAYHGSTIGALSILGDEYFKRPFRPLMPAVEFLEYNNNNLLELIDAETAAVIVEPIQAESGIYLPEDNYLLRLREKCDEVGALLIFDEVQTGFGRTGKLFAFEHFGVVPDIMLLAKGMGGGMPIGAFVAPRQIMDSFKNNPVLGHITTFGGHPVSCAAGNASLNVIKSEKLFDRALHGEKIVRENLLHRKIKEIRGKGLLLSVDLGDEQLCQKAMSKILEKGIITGDFLFNNTSFSINPPLIISDEELLAAIQLIANALDEI